MPKSLIFKYPLSSNTKFSGFISLWIILLKCKYSRPNNVHARKNSILKINYLRLRFDLLVCSSLKVLFWITKYLKSPPAIKSNTK